MVKGHLFQVDCWAKNPSEGVNLLLWIKEIGKDNGQGIKEEKIFLAHLFMKIKEIRRKGR